jgi:hypothetical protein
MIEKVPVSSIHFESQPGFRCMVPKLLGSFLFLFFLFSCSPTNHKIHLDVYFNGSYGQVEIGGKYIGVEFHQSRPLPSRISFYYPVANSIDYSTDYWERYKSFPFTIVIKSESKTSRITIRLLFHTMFVMTFRFLFSR